MCVFVAPRRCYNVLDFLSSLVSPSSLTTELEARAQSKCRREVLYLLHEHGGSVSQWLSTKERQRTKLGSVRVKRKRTTMIGQKNKKKIESPLTPTPSRLYENNVDDSRQVPRILESLYVEPCLHSPLGEGRGTTPATPQTSRLPAGISRLAHRGIAREGTE